MPLNKYDVREFRSNHFSGFHTYTDDYLQYTPIVFAYGLNILPKMKSKSDFINKSVLLLKSEIIMASMVYPLKYFMNDKRPDSDATNAWPSGHTAQAFVAATFLDKEFRDNSIWISIGSYTCAASVAIIRVLNDRHWSADILAGAGIGILSTQIAYHTHQYKWGNNKKINYSLIPYWNIQNKGISLFIRL